MTGQRGFDGPSGTQWRPPSSSRRGIPARGSGPIRSDPTIRRDPSFRPDQGPNAAAAAGWCRAIARRAGLFVAAVLVGIAAAGCAPFEPSHERAIDPAVPLEIARQGSFFVGGRDIDSTTLSTLPAYPAAGAVTVDQVYVRYQVPVASATTPLVLIHGCCLTGKSWETTPDGRMGWDEYFARRGFPVYVIDQAGRGRSATDISAINAVRTGEAPVEALPTVFAAAHEGAWTIFRFGPEYPRVFPGLKFPLEAQAELWRQMVPDWLNALPAPTPTIDALGRLGQSVHGAVMISHSQSGIFPFEVVRRTPDAVRAIIAIEPAACPAADGDLTPFRAKPTLVMFGDYVESSPRWAPRLQACRAFVEALKASGGQADLLVLPEVGIRGNSHMPMQDSNSLELADLLVGWLGRQSLVEPGP